jgi:cobalt-precorrin-5B (C1)-methyltransferase
VEVTLPDGETVLLPVVTCGKVSATSAFATVLKDAGDDPDVTHGSAISVAVAIDEGVEGDVIFRAGEGVGTVTRPGLQISPGEPAINPVPRSMMVAAVRAIFPRAAVEVTVSVAGGEELAKKTFNPKLGIIGGISILGTSGRVVPRSEDAWLRSLIPQIDLALAAGKERLVFASGSFGAALRSRFPWVDDLSLIHIGNFVGDMLWAASKRDVKEIVLAGHVGKLVKVAAGLFNTHSRFGDARLETVAAFAARAGATPLLVRELLGAATAEAAVAILHAAGLDAVWSDIADRVVERATAHAGVRVHCVLTDYRGDLLGCSTELAGEMDWRPFTECPSSDDVNGLMPAIAVVGVGPGAPEFMTAAGWQLLAKAEVVVGGARHLQQFASMSPHAAQIPIGSDMQALAGAVRDYAGKRVVFLASGDPLCYGIAEFVLRHFSASSVRILPGVSAFQMALSRLGVPWEGVSFASVHGRPLDAVLPLFELSTRLLILTDARQSAQVLAARLRETYSCSDFRIVVLERLGAVDETITCGSLAEIEGGVFDPLAVVYFERRG